MLGANATNLDLQSLPHKPVKTYQMHKPQPESKTIHCVAFYIQIIQMIGYLKVVISQPMGQKIPAENEDDFQERKNCTKHGLWAF